MATEVPRTARIAVPEWFWGGHVPGYFKSARLQAEPPTGDGRIVVTTLERAERTRPRLLDTRELRGPNAAEAPFNIGRAEKAALDGLGRVSLTENVDVEAHLERLMERVQASSGLNFVAAGFSLHKLQVTASAPDDLDLALTSIYDDLRAMSFAESGAHAFPYASVHFVRREPALLHRMKLASVMVRLAHDEALRKADINAIKKANGRGEQIFAASSGLGEGVTIFDAYLGPLLGAITPFIWAFGSAARIGDTSLRC